MTPFHLRSALPATALLALSTLITGIGCGGGTSNPAGTRTSTPATNSQTNSQAPATQSIRLVGFFEGQVFPGNGQSVWLVWTPPFSVKSGSEALIVNGAAPQSITPTTIGAGAGAIDLASLLSGDTAQIAAQDTSGARFISNVITVNRNAPLLGNSPTGVPAFQATTPLNQQRSVNTTPNFIWTPAQTVSTYLLMSFAYIPSLRTAGQRLLAQPDVMVEVVPRGLGNQQFQTFATVAPGSGTVFANGRLIPGGHQYTWSVVALDATGFGVGTTVDVSGFNFNPGGPAAATWPTFFTQ